MLFGTRELAKRRLSLLPPLKLYDRRMSSIKLVLTDLDGTVLKPGSNAVSPAVKVAMGNACEELKKIANYVVEDVQHDGFASALRQFVLVS